jgi:hypothetical protein
MALYDYITFFIVHNTRVNISMARENGEGPIEDKQCIGY